MNNFFKTNKTFLDFKKVREKYNFTKFEVFSS